jgi:signal transduction histidine kinase
MNPACGKFLCTALAGVILLGAAPSQAQSAVQHVLVLQSLDRGNLATDSFTGDFRVELDRRAGTPTNVVQVVVGPTGFVGAPEQAVIDYIHEIFAGRSKPDLIVTVGGPAAVFARKHRQQLFPGTPLLFASVDERFLRDAPLGENETAVAIDNDFPGLVDDILQLLPHTKQVFVVTGSGQLGQFWRRELEDLFTRFHERVGFVWSNDLSLPEILRRCANLPRDSAILYLSFGTDAVGGAYADERVLANLHATVNAPLFSSMSPLLGHGIVGARLMSIDNLARNTADVAIRLLNGAPPSSIDVRPQRPGQAIFDWRELQRWGIAEDRLPAGVVVRYRSPSLWDQYRGYVMGGAALLAVQTLFIFGLLVERKRRRQAEAKLLTSLDRIHEIGGRLLNAQDIERTRIAQELHDDISQQVAALKWHLQLLTGLVNDEAVSVASEAVQYVDGLLTSIRDLSHSLYPTRLQMFGLVPALEGLLSELSDHGPRMTFTSEKVPEKLPPDVTVTVFRIAQEALQNALKHSRAENVWVKVSGDRNSVALAVVDDGVGFVVDDAWSNGLGLISIGERVESIGGTWKVQSSPLRGTTVHVEIPLSAISADVGSEKQSPEWAENV